MGGLTTQFAALRRTGPRKQAADRKKAQQDHITSIFNKYDTDSSGKLSKLQLTKLLTDLNQGNIPTEEELAMVLHVADAADGKLNGMVDRKEFLLAIDAWKSYQDNLELIRTTMQTYDINNSGVLERDQLAQLLKDINDGQAPTEEEIDFILISADLRDGITNGAINSTELMFAINLWFSMLEEEEEIAATIQKKKSCSIA
ncbi:hypothetical protein CYMTET_20080 [Cymbomonas tetramitiformis]|uniref:EF-hand domain-containing protein n=1 Tax=Cymbomonas tetramitiformis TaxID=36881 RepID=A0AAE0G4U1_9CHLO|nr:hypothetical protein CYMTET_20080 [Cymbomonas tetramitiformis]